MFVKRFKTVEVVGDTTYIREDPQGDLLITRRAQVLEGKMATPGWAIVKDGEPIVLHELEHLFEVFAGKRKGLYIYADETPFPFLWVDSRDGLEYGYSKTMRKARKALKRRMER